MKLEHLGDALDHWKGSTIVRMRPILCDLHVVPMLTDAPWKEAHLRLYSTLLRLPTKRILLQDRCFSHEERDSYFGKECLNGEFDLFLDPNTGIETPATCDERHIKLDDLEVLLPPASGRLLLVYQHSQPYYMRDSVLNRIPAIQARWPSFAIWAGAVSMVFVSRKDSRIIAAQDRVRQWLGPCAQAGYDCPARLLDWPTS